MRFILFLLGLLIFTSCDTSVKKAPNLLDCVPQNSFAAFQLNDQNMLENALTNLPFLTEIIALDSSLNEDIKTIIPPVFSSKALLCFTPEGKSEIALSFIYKINPSDSLPELSGDPFLYNNTTIRVSQKNQRKIYSTTLKGLQIINAVIETAARILTKSMNFSF